MTLAILITYISACACIKPMKLDSQFLITARMLLQKLHKFSLQLVIFTSLRKPCNCIAFEIALMLRAMIQANYIMFMHSYNDSIAISCIASFHHVLLKSCMVAINITNLHDVHNHVYCHKQFNPGALQLDHLRPSYIHSHVTT